MFGGGPVFLNVPVNVAGHQVQFDTERQLWFCDIDVEVDYAQLAPDRSLSAGRQPGSRKIVVTLAGVDGPTVAGIGVAEAWVEAKDLNIPSPQLGWGRIGPLVDLSPSNTGAYRTWSGRLNLPGGGRPLRLVVPQFERFPAVQGTLVPAGPPVRRLVHSDIVVQ